MYNSASLALVGDESLSVVLRILVSAELFLHADFYAGHSYLQQSDDNECTSLFKSPNSAFTIALSEASAPMYQNHDRISCVQKEAAVVAEDGEWSSLMCMLALSTVLKQKVRSLYPKGGRLSTEKLMEI